MADVQLVVDPRMVTGKKVKALRRQGVIPAHLYGHGTESLAVQISAQAVTTLLRNAGANAIIDLHINGEGEPRPVVLRGVQRDPVTGELVHVDFFQISLTERLHAEVPLVLTGEAPAVSIYGGVLLQTLDHLPIEALPTDVPDRIEVNVSQLDSLESTLFVRDLFVPASVQVLAEPGQVVAKVAAPRLVAEIEREEAVAAEEAAVAEGEAPAPEEETKEDE